MHVVVVVVVGGDWVAASPRGVPVSPELNSAGLDLNIKRRGCAFYSSSTKGEEEFM